MSSTALQTFLSSLAPAGNGSIKSIVNALAPNGLGALRSITGSFDAVVASAVTVTYSFASNQASSQGSLTLPAGTFGTDFSLAKLGTGLGDLLDDLDTVSFKDLLSPASVAKVSDLLDDLQLDALIPRLDDLAAAAEKLLTRIADSDATLSVQVTGGPIALDLTLTNGDTTVVLAESAKPQLTEPFSASFDFAAMAADALASFMTFG